MKRINLALQGGGAHGALTWGAPDYLLGDGRLEIAAISGTSDGAMNTVALADFDDLLVGHFLALVQQGGLKHVLRYSADEIPLQICPMCNSTLVIQRGYLTGRHIDRGSSSGKFVLVPTAEGVQAEPNGVTEDAKDLAPASEADLIRRVVAQAAEHLAAQDLFGELVLEEVQHHAA